MRLLILFFASLLLPLSDGNCHPVTYKDGGVLQSEYHPEHQSFHLHYSVSPRKAYALAYDRITEADSRSSSFITTRINYLLKRWNELSSQANVYLWGGPAARVYAGDTHPALNYGFMADWESQRWHTMLRGQAFQADGDKDFHMLTSRLGVAPYIGEFDDIHTWFMAQASYHPEQDKEWGYAGLIRLFYKNYLAEIGVHHDGSLLGTLMYHFDVGL